MKLRSTWTDSHTIPRHRIPLYPYRSQTIVSVQARVYPGQQAILLVLRVTFKNSTHKRWRNGYTNDTAQTRTRPKELRSEFSMLLARELDFSTRSDSRGGPGRVGSELLQSFSYSNLLAER